MKVVDQLFDERINALNALSSRYHSNPWKVIRVDKWLLS